MTDTHLTDIRFSSFDLPEILLEGIEKSGFEFCTPIQAATIPKTLKGQDVAGQAQTGTGKTAAFLSVVYANIINNPVSPDRKNNQPLALILAPTRELAIQIHKDAVKMAGATGLTIGLVYGGVDYEKQKRAFTEGVDILIATPGRLIDFFKQKVFNFRRIQVLVLDEADRMFDMGFIKDIRYILRRLPKPDDRLNMLFSATLSLRVMELAYEHMNNPEKVIIETDDVTADNISQKIYYPANDEKIPLLAGLIRKHNPGRSIIFTNTKHAANKIEQWLNANDISTALLSGDVPQKKRQHLLTAYTNGEYKALVATDVAARGLHIPEVDHVFNYDLPQSGEDYVHRIGRTARAGATGSATSFACEDTSFYLPDIESYIGKSIPMATVTDELTPKLTKPPYKKPPSSRNHPNKHRRNPTRNQKRR